MSIDQCKLLFLMQNICSTLFMQKTTSSRNVLVLILNQRFISTQYLMRKLVGKTKIKELLDSTSRKDFEKQHQKLKKIWETRPNDNKFVRCIAINKIQHFPDNMLAKVREKCGLGSPPKYYNHNANETISSLIKRAKCRGKLSLKKKQFSCCKRKSEIKKKTSSLLFLEKVKSAFLIVFRMLGRVAGGRGFVCPFLSSPNDLRKRSISKAVQSILRKVFF